MAHRPPHPGALEVEDDRDVPSNRPPPPKQTFGIPRRSPTEPVNPYDYEQKYAEDDYGEELGPYARFWRVLLDEARVYDNDMLEGWRDTLDVLLVFAGLFSAVVTTMVVQSSQDLKPDYALIAASLLTEMIALQRAWASGSPIQDVPDSQITLQSINSTALDRWCNALWFISLALSLSTALIAVLVKQWLQAYKSDRSGTPQDQALARTFRLNGVNNWNVPLIVGLLPTLLHAALLLFFIGLCLYLFSFSTAIAWAVAAITILVYALYLAANIMPMLNVQCPYKTPLSHHGYLAVRHLLSWVLGWAGWAAGDHSLADHFPSTLDEESLRIGLTLSPVTTSPRIPMQNNRTGVIRRLRSSLLRLSRRFGSPSSTWTSRHRETVAISHPRVTISLTTESINWVYDMSSNPSAVNVAIEAVSGLPAATGRVMRHDTMLREILTRLGSITTAQDRVPIGVFEQGINPVHDCLARGLSFFDADNIILKADLERCEAPAARITPYYTVLGDLIRQGFTSVPSARSRLGTWRDFSPDTIGDLPFLCQSRPSSLSLHPAVWTRFLRFLATSPFQDWYFAGPDDGVHMAIFIWRRFEAAVDSSDALRLNYMGLTPLQVTLTHDLSPDARVAICRLLWKDPQPALLQNITFSDLLFRAVEQLVIALDKPNTTCIPPSILAVYDEEIGFLARLFKISLTPEQVWSKLDMMSRLALPTSSVATRADMFFAYAQRSRNLPPGVLRPLVNFLVQLAVLSVPQRAVEEIALSGQIFNDLCNIAFPSSTTDDNAFIIVVQKDDIFASVWRHLCSYMVVAPEATRFVILPPSELFRLCEAYIGGVARAIRARKTDATISQDLQQCVSYVLDESDDPLAPPSHLTWSMLLSMQIALEDPHVPFSANMLHVVVELAQLTSESHAEAWAKLLSRIESRWLLYFPDAKRALRSKLGKRSYRMGGIVCKNLLASFSTHAADEPQYRRTNLMNLRKRRSRSKYPVMASFSDRLPVRSSSRRGEGGQRVIVGRDAAWTARARDSQTSTFVPVRMLHVRWARSPYPRLNTPIEQLMRDLM